MRDSKPLVRRIGPVKVLAILGLLLVAACAPTQEAPRLQPPRQAGLPWQAAIGELATADPNVHCSAVLVARDLIATAAHCLFLSTAQRPSQPNEMVFRPNMGGVSALPPSRGVAFRSLGGIIRGGRIRNEDVPKDWALIQISPPVTAVQPLPVAGLPIDGMLKMVSEGDRLITAGYGNGAYDELRQHDACRIIPQRELGIFEDDSTLLLDCVFRVGDSGGAILLIDGANQPALIGIISGFGRKPRSTDPIGLGVNAANFQPYLGIPISQQAPHAPVDLLAGDPN
jgi:hypothetical protein